MGGREGKSKRFMQSIQRLIRSLSDVAGRLVEEFSVSDFRPEAFELKIGYLNEEESRPAYVITDEDGSTVSIHGSVDRVDTASIKGKNYLRVIDYKHSTLQELAFFGKRLDLYKIPYTIFSVNSPQFSA